MGSLSSHVVLTLQVPLSPTGLMDLPPTGGAGAYDVPMPGVAR